MCPFSPGRDMHISQWFSCCMTHVKKTAEVITSISSTLVTCSNQAFPVWYTHTEKRVRYKDRESANLASAKTVPLLATLNSLRNTQLIASAILPGHGVCYRQNVCPDLVRGSNWEFPPCQIRRQWPSHAPDRWSAQSELVHHLSATAGSEPRSTISFWMSRRRQR